MRRRSSLVGLAICALSALSLTACRGAGARSDDTASSPDSAPATSASASAGGGGDVTGGPARRGEVPVAVSVAVGGATQAGTRGGECKHEPNGSIYGVPAALWSVSLARDNGGVRSLHLTVWRPKAGGPDQLSLAVDVGSASHRIDTVKGSTPAGSGTVSFQPRGAGGRFEIDGRAEDGATIRATIDCPSFSGIVAEGG